MKLEIELIGTHKRTKTSLATLVADIPGVTPFYIAYNGLMSMLNRESIEIANINYKIKLEGHTLRKDFTEAFTEGLDSNRSNITCNDILGFIIAGLL